MKRALIVAATGGFLNGFLIPDMKLLQEMGYEVHCAANGNSVSTFVPEERFASIGVTFHQIDFSSTSPVSKESLTAYKQYKELLNRYHFDFVHVHTPIPGAIVRIATRRKRKEGCVVVYTTHGLTFPKGSSLKTKIVYGGVEWFCSWMTDGIITINKEDYTQMKKMACKNVYHINGVGVDTSRYHECQIDRDRYRESLGLSESDIAILEVGELSTRKNHKVIIEALSKINDKHYVFLICGKAMSNLGTYDFLKKYAEEKNVRVIFLGFRKDIPEINRCVDIAVLPSLREGLGQIPWYQKKRTADFLKRLDYISMRENRGSEIVKELTGLDAPVILDPVFNFDKEQWEKLIPIKKEMDEPYIFAYFLGANPEYRKQVRKLAESTGLKIVALRHMDQYVEDDESFGDYAPYDVAPDRFLNLLRGAEYVCTDSFHGTCFSIINEKKFMIFNRYANTSATSKNSRIDSLCQNLGVSDRRFSGDISTIQKIIDYEKVYCKLAKLKQKTDQYINAAFMG